MLKGKNDVVRVITHFDFMGYWLASEKMNGGRLIQRVYSSKLFLKLRSETKLG